MEVTIRREERSVRLRGEREAVASVWSQRGEMPKCVTLGKRQVIVDLG